MVPWRRNSGKRAKRQSQIALSDRHSSFTKPATDAMVKFRDRSGRLRLDRDARLVVGENGKVYLQSTELAKDLLARPLKDVIFFVQIEQIDEVLRTHVHLITGAKLRALSEERAGLRLESFGLPPYSVTEIEPSIDDGSASAGMFDFLLGEARKADAGLFSVHTDAFLKAPHIVVPLLNHLSSLSADDNLKFPLHLKRLADQFRAILETKESPLRVHKIERDHLTTWAEAQGNCYAYLDGGVAKIAGLPGTEPTAMRVGIYSVTPGEINLDHRENWGLQPFVVGDIIDKNTGVHIDDHEQIDLRRLGEAARYTLESLCGLRFVDSDQHVAAVFLHGPLINQFVMYDEGGPHFIPFLTSEFLRKVGIERADVEGNIKEIPKRGNERMWRQFMAVYGYIIKRICESTVPFVGVVERGPGIWLATAVLDHAVSSHVVTADYKRKVINLLKRYAISDEFLFGCILAEGEYVTPVMIIKNEPRRAREIWKRVVEQYPNPYATILKTADVSFPFRIEMNPAGYQQEAVLMRLLYHTARLLPRYAFPVGLDIVDKYAKVPDWLSRNISARLAASVLNRAMAEGNARLIAQVRQLLAHTPRDFFYRPKT
jgi:hypothetical protein